MNSLFWSYNMTVDKAYIIRVNGNEKSETFAKRCSDSCTTVGQPWEYWDAFDGIEDGPIKVPAALKDDPVIKMIKVTDHYMTRGEVACALSHISLWAKCVVQDQPLIILEHDAVMAQPYPEHHVYNSICYLGSHEQKSLGWGVYPTPPHASEGRNYHFICRAHAYAIDPSIAKNLLAHVIKYGINAPLDILIRADIFPMHQFGVYAHDTHNTDTTIIGRPKEGRSTVKNDYLTF